MTIGILSWGSYETLEQTLKSYRTFGLDKRDEDRIIFFQEISDEDFRVAQKYGWMPFGSPDNVGIAKGYEALVNAAEGELFLFLENDWKLLARADRPIHDARFLLTSGAADVVRLRHRKEPGGPLWTKQFENQEELRWTHLLDCVHWRANPDQVFPDKIKKQRVFASAMDLVGTDWYIANAHYANWTNNPHMAYTRFIKDTVIPHIGGGNLEQDIQGWWEQQDFNVAQGQGLFQHNRID